MARQLHDEAWRMLTKVRWETDLSQNAYFIPSTVAAVLLRQTARLAPEQLPCQVWQTIVLRRPMHNSERLMFAADGCFVEMAATDCQLSAEYSVAVSVGTSGQL
jgi:hypothetical protein